MSTTLATLLQPHPSRIVVVGAGIVGAHLAQQPSSQIVVLDRSLTPLLGSTGHAPGFVGQLNSILTLTELAKRSVSFYRTVEGGFQVVGGLEVAETEEAVEVLKERLQLAQDAGLEGKIITPGEAKKLSPSFIDEDKTKAALFFPTDGTARADILTATARKKAEKLGALFIEADVVEVRIKEGIAEGVETTSGFVSASKVIITTGIWASQTLRHLPVLPVAHPYIHSLPRDPLPGPPSPFVRWPASHVYARDHGDCSGLGSYDHPPVAEDKLGAEAIGQWRPDFERVLAEAYERLPEASRAMFTGGKAFNGIFSTTPDNLPLIGKVSEGLYACVAVWVTHAAASAEVLAGLLDGKGREGDEELLKVLDPKRFEGRDVAELRKLSFRAYNDIYNRGDE
ncbi:FAD dependent oxidoreductase [Leucosporidium creatinivorum]|uniref:FAD dependent oxidoreductase n=1 Tax=Leucosporidium creatinivorum TaxID=106004 RepID=A0A1Y2FWT8_9BASI|nr:FAD dependent oxidoreductase [Leucosporidium creatinivorum]